MTGKKRKWMHRMGRVWVCDVSVSRRSALAQPLQEELRPGRQQQGEPNSP